MRIRVLYRLFGLLGLFVLPCATSVVFAHEGEEGPSAPAVLGEAAHPTHVATTSDLEVVIRHEPLLPGQVEDLVIYLSDFATNAPIARAQVDLTLRSTAGVAWHGTARPDVMEGVYHASAIVRSAGTYNLIVRIGGPRQATVAMSKILVGAEERVEAPAHRTLPAWLVPALLALAIGVGVGVALGRRRGGARASRTLSALMDTHASSESAQRSGPPRALLCALAFAGLALASRTRAHEGHDAPPAASGAVLMPGGAVWMAKESQFAARVRTILVHAEESPVQLQLLGRVAPSPQGRAEISAPQSGRIDPVGRAFPLLGQSVRKGQPLAALLVIDALTVRSPIAGVVSEVNVVPGQMVQAGQKLFEVVDLSVVWVHADVFPADLAAVNNATRALVTIPGLPATPLLMGRRVATGSTAGETPGTTEVWFAVSTSSGVLKPGAVVNVAVETSTSQTGVRIPRSALLDRNGQTVAFVHTAPERFVMRALTVQAGAGETVLVTGGLAADDRVVVSGAYQLLTGGVPLATP
jgi:multidrug efflux pump subunit AcrA (membrane-fusion protein)